VSDLSTIDPNGVCVVHEDGEDGDAAPWRDGHEAGLDACDVGQDVVDWDTGVVKCGLRYGVVLDRFCTLAVGKGVVEG
jgi:hypothetical protein